MDIALGILQAVHLAGCGGEVAGDDVGAGAGVGVHNIGCACTRKVRKYIIIQIKYEAVAI